MWWYTLIISALKRLRQEDGKFETSLGCIIKPCLKQKPKRPLSSQTPRKIRVCTDHSLGTDAVGMKVLCQKVCVTLF
jgi:hypothetical protein